MADHRPDLPDQGANPPPLTVAASLVAVQGLALITVAVVEALSVVEERMAVAVSVAAFFAAYGVALVGCAVALTRRVSWVRGPVLISQLIALGIAWNVRDVVLLALLLALSAAVVLAGMLNPATMDALLPRAEEP